METRDKKRDRSPLEGLNVFAIESFMFGKRAKFLEERSNELQGM